MKGLQEECELSSMQPIHQLSFGQKKKFLITFALATRCRLLLLDEPTNGLDIPSKSRVVFEITATLYLLLVNLAMVGMAYFKLKGKQF